jgi:hypothetical protein
VLDLAGTRVTPLAGTNSVDDQAAWLDDTTVAYTLRTGDGGRTSGPFRPTAPVPRGRSYPRRRRPRRWG